LAVIAAPVAAAAVLSLAPLGASHAATITGTRGTATLAPARTTLALPVMTMKMNGKSISVGGTLKSGGEKIVFTVTGNSELSSGAAPTLVRLDPGVSYAQFFKVLATVNSSGDPNKLYGVAQIVMSAEADKGTSSAQVYLQPGNYVGLDINAPTKMPPTATFAVTKATHPLALPKAAATISSIDFSFRGAAKVHDGELVRWQNDGYLVHMVAGVEAPNHATANKIAALLKAGKDNQAFALTIGGFIWDNALSHGQWFQSVVSQKPGFWVLACFFSTEDGTEHTRLGMEKVIQIVK
jgi:hypothetical protein